MLGFGRKIQKPAIIFGVLLALFGLLSPLMFMHQTATAAGQSAYWDNGTLRYKGYAFKKKNSKTFYYSAPKSFSGPCDMKIVFTSDYHKATSAKYSTQNTRSLAGAGSGQRICESGSWTSPTTISIATSLSNGGGRSNPSSSGGGANCDEKDNQCTGIECPDNFSPTNALAWVMCPLANAMEGTADSLDGAINRLLCVNTGEIFNKASVCDESTQDDKKSNQLSSTAFKNAWNVFRIIALGLLAIAGLIMIISQAAGFEIFDAYSIRKILPRLLIAAIGVSLSWQILYFLVELSNVLGTGIRSIIYAPFVQAGIHLNFTLSGASGTAGSVALIAGLSVLGIFGLLSFIGTALLAALIAFLVLVFRNLLIFMLVILAPIAIACYVLPNTQKVWKYWWDWFFMGLMAFPIIEAFIATGRVFAGVISTGDPGGIENIIAFIAYFIPYFLLPFAFRLAGGAMATIGGLVNDRSRGAFDRLKKYRAAQSAQNLQQMRTGSRFGKSKIMNSLGLASGLDKMTSRASTRNLGFGKEGQAAYEQKMAVAAGEFARTAAGQAMQHNDPALAAMTYRNAREARARLGSDFNMSADEIDEAVSAVQASGGFGKERQVWAAKQLAATGTGYENQAQMFATLSRVADGNSGLATSMWGDARALSERAGRNDMKSGFGSGNALLQEIMANGDSNMTGADLSKKYAAGYTYTDDQGEQVNDGGFLHLNLEAARGVDGMQMARNKPKAITNFTKGFQQAQQHYSAEAQSKDAGVRAAAQERLGQIQAQYDNFEHSAAYGPEVNAGIANSDANAHTQAALQREIDDSRTAQKARQRESLTGNIDVRAADEAAQRAAGAGNESEDAERQ